MSNREENQNDFLSHIIFFDNKHSGVVTCHVFSTVFTLLRLYYTIYAAAFIILNSATHLLEVSYKYRPIKDVFMSKTLATTSARGRRGARPFLRHLLALTATYRQNINYGFIAPTSVVTDKHVTEEEADASGILGF